MERKAIFNHSKSGTFATERQSICFARKNGCTIEVIVLEGRFSSIVTSKHIRLIGIFCKTEILHSRKESLDAECTIITSINLTAS